MEIYDGSSDKKAVPTRHTVAVVSAGRIACGRSDQMTIRKTGREDWSLFFCEAGRLHFEDRTLEPGQIWIYPPAIPQKYVMYAREKPVYRYLHFTGSDLARIFSSLGIEPLMPIKLRDGRISDAFDSIQMCMTDDSPLSKLKAEYHTLYLISHIAKSKRQNSGSGMMKRITDNMEHSFAAEYDAQAYAAMLNISVSRFNHLFKESMGRSPYAYYLNLRIENAVSLLEDTDMKIKEIARQCGFEDPLYFAQVFKRMRGMTPTGYRRLNGRIK